MLHYQMDYEPFAKDEKEKKKKTLREPEQVTRQHLVVVLHFFVITFVSVGVLVVYLHCPLVLCKRFASLCGHPCFSLLVILLVFIVAVCL